MKTDETNIADPDYIFMRWAVEEAKAAGLRDEVPIGAVLVDPRTGTIIARDGNRTRELNDPTAHAEIMVIRAGCAAAGAQRIPDYDLYVTLEPCAMCAAAISFARIRRLVFAAPDPKGGGVIHGGRFFEGSTCHHRPEVAHAGATPLAEQSATLLREFFKLRREPAPCDRQFL